MLAGKKKPKHHNIKKDYQTKNLENPFFRRNHAAKKSRTLNIRWYLIGILIIIILIIYGLFASPLFAIRDIKINGLGRLPESAISQRLWDQTNKKAVWPLSQKNIWLFNKKTAETDLLANFNFSKITLSKKLFHTLIVDIEERPYAFIWQEKDAQGAEQSYYSDSKGYIIRDSQVNPDDLKKFPIIENVTPNSLIENDNLKISPDYISFIFNLKNAAEKSPETAIERYLINQELNTVQVKFQNGLLAYFNVKDDVDKQMEKLLVVKNDKIKDNLSNINYVDLRYGDKVYIGYKK
jgi:cell division septal protein FtsQ